MRIPEFRGQLQRLLSDRLNAAEEAANVLVDIRQSQHYPGLLLQKSN